jgi:hypothetical protein
MYRQRDAMRALKEGQLYVMWDDRSKRLDWMMLGRRRDEEIQMRRWIVYDPGRSSLISYKNTLGRKKRVEGSNVEEKAGAGVEEWKSGRGGRHDRGLDNV